MAQLKDLFSIYQPMYKENKNKLNIQEDPILDRLINFINYRINQPVEEKINTDVVKPETTNDIKSKTVKAITSKGVYQQQQTINNNFDNILNNIQNIEEEDKYILKGIATLESSLIKNAKNPKSSASGYFQFTDSTRTSLSSVSKEEFMKNEQLQIESAYKYLKQLKKILGENNYWHAREIGLSPFQIMYGMWWRPASMKNYIQNMRDDYVDPQGNTIYTILNKAKRYDESQNK